MLYQPFSHHAPRNASASKYACLTEAVTLTDIEMPARYYSCPTHNILITMCSYPSKYSFYLFVNLLDIFGDWSVALI